MKPSLTVPKKTQAEIQGMLKRLVSLPGESTTRDTQGDLSSLVDALVAKTFSIQGLPDCVSRSNIVTTCIGVLMQSNNLEEGQTLYDWFMNYIMEQVDDHSVIVPIVNLFASDSFDLLSSTVSPFEKHIAEHSHKLALDTYRTILSRYARLATISIKVVGDREFAQRTAFEKANDICSICKFYNLSSVDPWKTLDFYPLQTIEHRNSLELVFGPGTTQAREYQRNLTHTISSETIAQGRTLHLTECEELFQEEQNSDLASSLKRAIVLFARSSGRTDLSDRVLDAVTALESIAPANARGTIKITLIEILAFTIGKDAEDRLRIKTLINKIYRMRSEIVHNGNEVVDTRLLANYLKVLRLYLITMLTLHQSYESKGKYMEAIERKKFS